MVWVLFLLVGVGVQDVATETPSSSVEGDVAVNAVLRFGIVAGLLLVGALAQFLFRFLIYERYVEDPLHAFVDLCSVANVSLLSLPERYSGVYLHGVSWVGGR